MYLSIYLPIYLLLVLKADKSQDLQTDSASWRPRRADDLVSVSVYSPGTQEQRSLGPSFSLGPRWEKAPLS